MYACNVSGACSTCRGHMPDGGHAAPTSWEHVEAVPGVWHMPGTVHIPVASRMRSVRRMRLTCQGCVPRAGDACWMVGTLPPHPGNTQKLSRACATCLGRCMSQSRVQDAFCACTRAMRPGHV